MDERTTSIELRSEFEQDNGLLLKAKDKVEYLGKYSCHLEQKLITANCSREILIMRLADHIDRVKDIFCI